MNYKQVIVVRQDLKMPKGKIASQCSHASVEAVLKSEKVVVEKWRSQGMPKIILKVADLKELIAVKAKASKKKLTTALITDGAHTFFKEPTVTCLGIGPDLEEKIDTVTGHLKMM